MWEHKYRGLLRIISIILKISAHTFFTGQVVGQTFEAAMKLSNTIYSLNDNPRPPYASSSS